MELATLHDLLRFGRLDVRKYLRSVTVTTRVGLGRIDTDVVSEKSDGLTDFSACPKHNFIGLVDSIIVCHGCCYEVKFLLSCCVDDA